MLTTLYLVISTLTDNKPRTSLMISYVFFWSVLRMRECYRVYCNDRAAIAQLGERQTEDLKVPGSIPGLGIFFHIKGSGHG